MSLNYTVIGIHAALLSVGNDEGSVLFFSYHGENYENNFQHGICSIWNPTAGGTGIVHEGQVDPNPFCSGHAFSTYGNLLVVGGHHPPGAPGFGGLSAERLFTPDGRQWHDFGQLYCGLPEGPEAVKRRWYSTCVTLPGYGQPNHDQLFIVSGTTSNASNPNTPVNGTYEFRPQQSGSPANRELEPLLSHDPMFQHPMFAGQGQTGHATYPFVFVLPNDRMLMHTNNVSQFFTLSNNTVVTQGSPFAAGDTNPHPAPADSYGIPRAYPNPGTAVLLPLLPPDYNAHVMLIGGGGGLYDPGTGLARFSATNTCLRLDTNQSVWNQTTPMSFGRVMPDAVLLPDATVLVVGGASKGEIANAEDPVYAAERFNPFEASDNWRVWQSMSVPRGYHATALLLPDGRVMTAGSADNNRNSDPRWPTEPPGEQREFRVEVLTPPYLFDRAEPGPVLAPRPVITAAPDTIGYSHDAGENVFSVDFQLPPHIDLDQPVSEVALIRSGSVTHSFNADQRYVGLAFTQTPTPRGEDNRGTLEVTPPRDGHVAPPGYYMLFIVTGTRVDYEHASTNRAEFKCPSVAKFVRLCEPP